MYMAPEVLTGKGAESYDAFKADIWSLGVILFVMVAGIPPMKAAESGDRWFGMISEGRWDDFWADHNVHRAEPFGEDFKVVIQAMLHPNPRDRRSIRDLCGAPWVTTVAMHPDDMKKEMLRRAKIAAMARAETRERADTRKEKKVILKARGPPSHSAAHGSVVGPAAGGGGGSPSTATCQSDIETGKGCSRNVNSGVSLMCASVTGHAPSTSMREVWLREIQFGGMKPILMHRMVVRDTAVNLTAH